MIHLSASRCRVCAALAVFHLPGTISARAQSVALGAGAVTAINCGDCIFTDPQATNALQKSYRFRTPGAIPGNGPKISKSCHIRFAPKLRLCSQTLQLNQN